MCNLTYLCINCLTNFKKIWESLSKFASPCAPRTSVDNLCLYLCLCVFSNCSSSFCWRNKIIYLLADQNWNLRSVQSFDSNSKSKFVYTPSRPTATDHCFVCVCCILKSVRLKRNLNTFTCQIKHPKPS